MNTDRCSSVFIRGLASGFALDPKNHGGSAKRREGCRNGPELIVYCPGQSHGDPPVMQNNISPENVKPDAQGQRQERQIDNPITLAARLVEGADPLFAEID